MPARQTLVAQLNKPCWTVSYRAESPYANRGGGDRLLFVCFLMCAVHALAIFGIRFVAEEPVVLAPPPTVEIVISQTSNDTLPDESDYLGRSNSAGGDPEENESLRRSDAFASFSTEQDIGVAPLKSEQLNAPAPTEPAPDVLTANASAISVRSQPESEQEKEAAEINSLIDKQTREVASLTNELRLVRQRNQRRQRQLTINSNTREYIAAEYVSKWVSAVESVGNTNLPSAAQKLAGQVILEVNINGRGELIGSAILRSSGHEALDEAAKLSVKLASPFEPFTPKMLENVDILSIVRTWSYENSRLTTHAGAR